MGDPGLDLDSYKSVYVSMNLSSRNQVRLPRARARPPGPHVPYYEDYNINFGKLFSRIVQKPGKFPGHPEALMKKRKGFLLLSTILTKDSQKRRKLRSKWSLFYD
jgi:hypothetical protein